MSQPFVTPYIHYGFGKLKELRYVRGKKALIVTDKMIVQLGMIDKITKQLEKSKKPMEYRIFDEVEPNPSDVTVLKGKEVANEFNPDWIIAVGGGSAMDCAKAIWVLYEDPGITLMDISPVKRLKLRNKAKLITIPTTSGTGAEITFAAVITNAEKHLKMSLASFDLTPDIAIVDPSLTLTMPPKLTASTGLDALTHAVEGYTCSLRNEFSDGPNLKAIQMIFKWLPSSYKGSKDIENQDKKPREKMHYAATIAGIGFGNAGAGLAHGIGHSIGAVLNVPHGFCVGILLPYIVEFCDKTSRENFQDIVNFLQLKNGENATRVVANSIRKLMKAIEVPLSFKDYGINEEDFKKNFERIVQLSVSDLSTKMCPRRATDEDIRKIMEYSYSGKPIDF